MPYLNFLPASLISQGLYITSSTLIIIGIALIPLKSMAWKQRK